MKAFFLLAVLLGMVQPLGAAPGEIGEAARLSSAGVPFGKIVRVSGEVFSRDDRKDSGPFLRILEIDGKVMEKPVEMEFHPHQFLPKEQTQKVSKMNSGKVGFSGYFTGEFSGIVDGEFRFVPAYTGKSFSFRESFIVLKIEE